MRSGPATAEVYTLSLHAALPGSVVVCLVGEGVTTMLNTQANALGGKYKDMDIESTFVKTRKRQRGDPTYDAGFQPGDAKIEEQKDAPPGEGGGKA